MIRIDLHKRLFLLVSRTKRIALGFFLTMDVLCQLMRRLLVWHWPLNT